MTGLRIRNPQNVVGGLALIGIAILATWLGSELNIGRAMRMGPGYFPRILSILVAASGVVILGLGLFGADGPKLERWSLYRLGVVLGAIAFFAVLIRDLGLVLTGIGLVVIGSIAAPDLRWKETAIFTVALVAFSALLFPVALGLALPLWPNQ